MGILCRDATINLNQAVVPLRLYLLAQGSHLVQRVGHKRLPSEAWLNAHHEYQVQLCEVVVYRLNRRCWLDADTRLCARGVNLGNRSARVGTRLVVEGYIVGSRLYETLHISLWLNNHKVHIKHLCGGLAHGLHYGEAKRDIRHKYAVHNIYMNPLGLGAVNHLDIAFQVTKVSRQN